MYNTGAVQCTARERGIFAPCRRTPCRGRPAACRRHPLTRPAAAPAARRRAHPVPRQQADAHPAALAGRQRQDGHHLRHHARARPRRREPQHVALRLPRQARRQQCDRQRGALRRGRAQAAGTRDRGAAPRAGRQRRARALLAAPAPPCRVPSQPFPLASGMPVCVSEHAPTAGSHYDAPVAKQITLRAQHAHRS